MSAFCCSTSPDGSYTIGKRETLRKKFEKGTITTSELREYAMLCYKGKSNFVTVKVLGEPVQMTLKEYEKHYQGFTKL